MALLEQEEEAVRNGVRELLDNLPRFKSAADRLDAIEARMREWVTAEVAAHIAKASAAPAVDAPATDAADAKATS
jgi:tetrahydromethanopterin S-methyltransferase subunit G